MVAAASSARRAAGGGGDGVAVCAGAGGPVVRLALAAMGTRFELVLSSAGAAGGAGAIADLRAAGELALEEIRLAHERLSAFEPASLVSAINRQAGAAPVVVDPETFGLLELAREVHLASDGAFDITLGPLMRAWGFRGGSPDPAAAHAARAVCGMDLLSLDAASRRVALAVAGAQLDLGAIAKGHALDLAAGVLREHGVRCALLHGGTSTVVALGAPPGQEGWGVALADRGRRLGAEALLRDAALSVSSPAGRIVAGEGASMGHVLDPRTGSPAGAARYAAAVAPGGAAAGALADAWSTAALVCAGRPAGMPAEVTSLMLSAGAADWSLEGPAAAAIRLGVGEGGHGGAAACYTRESLA